MWADTEILRKYEVITDPGVTDRKLSGTEKLIMCTVSLPTTRLRVGQQDVLAKETDCTVISRKFDRLYLVDCWLNDGHNWPRTSDYTGCFFI